MADMQYLATILYQITATEYLSLGCEHKIYAHYRLHKHPTTVHDLM